MQGVEYDITFVENSSLPYYLNNINFTCSSSTLGERVHKVKHHTHRGANVLLLSRICAKRVL